MFSILIFLTIPCFRPFRTPTSHSKKSLRASKSLNGASFSTDISNQTSSGRGSSVNSVKNRNIKTNDRKNSNTSSDTDLDLASELEKLKVQDNNSLETKSHNWGTCGNGDSAISLGKSLGRTFTKWDQKGGFGGRFSRKVCRRNLL